MCREKTKTKTSIFNEHFRYKIVHSSKEGIMTLKNIKTKTLQSLEIDKVRKNFIFAWCSTCHSAQGSSINDEITIFEYNYLFVRNYKEWLWTALTGCRDLKKGFFKYNKNNTSDEFNTKCIISYYDRKIENHRVQDRTAKRTIPKEGDVNTQWLLDNFN